MKVDAPAVAFASVKFRVSSGYEKEIGVKRFSCEGDTVHTWGFIRFIASDEIGQHLIDGRLTLKCTVNVVAELHEWSPANHPLLKNQEKLSVSGEMVDFTFNCPDGQVKAHKLWLSAQSDVFKVFNLLYDSFRE